ncbi:hypothetical protein [Streptomyces lydicamycinicus]|uniref:hypothetical protein n=1 Tax=Streptomyces lydicamycinicus TaxID=1546107 RepID=UPI003C30738B
MQLQLQHRRMYQQKRQMRRGGMYGHGGGYGTGGVSPVIPYRTMQWTDYQIRVDQETFEHVPINAVMLQLGRGRVRARRHRTASGLMVAVTALWLVLWWLAPAAAAAVTAAAGVLAVAAAAWQGRYPTRRRPPVPRLHFIPADVSGDKLDADADPEPFPLKDAGRSAREAREALRLALKKEGSTPTVGTPTATEWGWRYPLTLTAGTLADLVQCLPDAATTLQLGTGRLMAQEADPDNSAAVTVRALLHSPFAAVPPAPTHAPRSISITEDHSLGISIDGDDDTPIVIAGQHILLVGVTGAGKSEMIRRLAERVTACYDAVAVDVDPTGVGLGPLRPAAVRHAYTPDGADRVLEAELARAEARIAQLGDGTADNFPVSADSPAVIVFVDEYSRLTDRGKAAALALLGIGRKARVTLVLSTRNAGKSVLKEAVADSLGVRIMMACRMADVPLVVGESDAVAQGWMPHRLRPSPGEWEPADAGQFYAITPRAATPVLRYVPRLAPERAAQLAQERVAAGLPDPDAAPKTATAAVAEGEAPELPRIAQQLRGAFVAAGDPPWLTLGQIADHLGAADPEQWAQWDGRRDRLAMVGRALRAALLAADIDVRSVRLETAEHPDRPTAYRLAHITAALDGR